MDMIPLYNVYAPIRCKMTFSREFLGKRRPHLSERDAGGKFSFPAGCKWNCKKKLWQDKMVRETEGRDFAEFTIIVGHNIIYS